jgi:hypothetical protein
MHTLSMRKIFFAALLFAAPVLAQAPKTAPFPVFVCPEGTICEVNQVHPIFSGPSKVVAEHPIFITESAQPAGQVHHSFAVRALGLPAGTLKTMVWPRHHWVETISLDLNMLSGVLQARAIRMGLSECIGCQETNPILGPTPSAARTWGFELGWTFAANMGTHALFNKARADGVPQVLAALPQGMLTGVQFYTAVHDYQVDVVPWRACWRDPACAARHGR